MSDTQNMRSGEHPAHPDDPCVNGHNAPFGVPCSVCGTDKRVSDTIESRHPDDLSDEQVDAYLNMDDERYDSMFPLNYHIAAMAREVRRRRDADAARDAEIERLRAENEPLRATSGRAGIS